jgi:hypothetical protein
VVEALNPENETVCAVVTELNEHPSIMVALDEFVVVYET